MLSRRAFIKGLGLVFLTLNLNITSFGQQVIDIDINVNVNGTAQKYDKDYEVIDNIVIFKEPPIGKVNIARLAK